MNYVISLTSHGTRLKHVSKCIFSILKQCNIPICLTVYKNDICNITDNLKLLIDTNTIELIIAEEDLGSNLKYYYAMKKYKDKQIITLDDDIIYENDVISSLINESKNFPDVVCARRVHLITFDKDGNALDNSNWKYEYNKINEPSDLLYATGVGGVIYPINFYLNAKIEENKSLMEKLKYQDDMFLKTLEIKYNFKVKYVKNNQKLKDIIHEDVQSLSMYKKNDGKSGRNVEYFKLVKSEFDKLYKVNN